MGHHIISHAPGSSAGYGRFNNSSFSSKLIQVPSRLDFWMWLHSWRGCSTAKGIGGGRRLKNAVSVRRLGPGFRAVGVSGRREEEEEEEEEDPWRRGKGKLEE